MTVHSVQYSMTAIEFELIYAQHKTLSITVHPEDLRVTVKAPGSSALSDIEAKVRKRTAGSCTSSGIWSGICPVSRRGSTSAVRPIAFWERE